MSKIYQPSITSDELLVILQDDQQYAVKIAELKKIV